MEQLFLKNTLLFRDMTPEETEQAQLALGVHVRHFPKDATILRAGSATAWMGMVLRGGATIESNDLWGNRVLLSHVGEGQYFVLADHRTDGKDSRFFGIVEKDEILGTVITIVRRNSL